VSVRIRQARPASRAVIAFAGSVAAVAVVALASGVAACSAILDTASLDRARCDEPSDCSGGETCDLASHVCTSAADATTVDGAADAGLDAATLDAGAGRLPFSDWQYELSTTSTLTLGGVAIDPAGNVLVVGTGGSTVTGENNAFGGGAIQTISATRYPEEFFSGLTGDGQNVTFNDKNGADDDGARTAMYVFAGDLVDAGAPADPADASLLTVTLAPGTPSVVALGAYRYDPTGVNGDLTGPIVRQKIIIDPLAAGDAGDGGDASGDDGGGGDAGVTTISLPTGLRLPSGAIYLAGGFAGAITVGKTTYTSLVNPLSGLPSNDGLLVRFDPSGSAPQVWVFATPYDDSLSSLCLVGADVGIGGTFTTIGAGDPLTFQGAPTGVVGSGKGDGFFAVLSDATGTLRLAVDVGGTNEDSVRAIAYLPAANQLVVGGRAQMPITLGGSVFDQGTMSDFALLAAFDATSGAAVWADLFPYGSPDSVINRLTVLPASGELLVGGQFSGELDVGAGAISSGGRSGFVAHLSADGGAVWSAPLGDSIHDLLLDADGGLLVSGTFTRPLALAGDASFAPTGSADGGAIFLAHVPSP
jgi:hypothetical protein